MSGSDRAAGPGPDPEADGGLLAPARRALTVGLLTMITLVAFEALAIATVMPRVADELGGLGLYGWAFSAFSLSNLVGIVAAGLLIDRSGPARPLALGAALFAFGLVVGGAAPSMPIVILGRLIQGFGGAAVPTVAFVAIGRAYPEATRARMFAAMSTAWVVPGLIGPAIAGLVADQTTWRLVFLGLVPFVALAAVVVVRALGALPRLVDEADARRMAHRLVSSLGVAVGAALLLVAAGRTAPLEAAGLAVAGVALGLPPLRRLLPPGTLTARSGVPSTVLVRGIATFAFFGAEAYVPLALVELHGLSLGSAGLVLTAATLSWTTGSWTQARLMPSWGSPRLIRTGFAAITVGLAGVIPVVSGSVPLAVTALAWAVGGFGMGLLYSPIAQLLLLETRSEDHGTTSASLQLSDVLGAALGTGLGGAFLAIGAALGQGPAAGLAAAFIAAAVVAAGGLWVAGRVAVPGLATFERAG